MMHKTVYPTAYESPLWVTVYGVQWASRNGISSDDNTTKNDAAKIVTDAANAVRLESSSPVPSIPVISRAPLYLWYDELSRLLPPAPLGTTRKQISFRPRSGNTHRASSWPHHEPTLFIHTLNHRSLHRPARDAAAAAAHPRVSDIPHRPVHCPNRCYELSLSRQPAPAEAAPSPSSSPRGRWGRPRSPPGPRRTGA